jgi:hypothetical protein
MFDSNPNTIIGKLIVPYFGIEAITAPDAMIAFPDNVAKDIVPAESDLYSISRSKGKIIFIYDIVIAPTFPGIHCFLPGPKKKSISAMRYIVPEEPVEIALLIYQYPSTVLSPVINTMTIPSNIKYYTVVKDFIAVAAIHSNADTRIE